MPMSPSPLSPSRRARALLLPILSMLVGIVLAAPGCSRGAGSDGPRDEQSLVVACTIGMVTDIVRKVAGEHAEVVGIIGEGVDPHTYNPTSRDIERMLRADAIFYNGLMLEGRMGDALVRVATSGKPVYAVTELIDPSSLLEPPEFAGHYDPHVWMDPSSWALAVRVVAEKLSSLDPEHRERYEANADALIGEIHELDSYARRVLGSVPDDRRVLVTAHDAFNYFARRYGFEVVGIQGISTESEAGLGDIERIVSLIVERRIPAVFAESTVSERNVRALVEGARRQGHAVTIGGRLYSDAMGPPGTYEGTYLGMIDHNVTTIARALGGDAPARGMRGTLSTSGDREQGP